MKRKLLFIVSIIAILTGCASGGHGVRSNIMASLFTSDNKTSQTATSNNQSYSNNGSNMPVYDKIDIDLTTMSSTMVYSEVYNMMDDPSTYRGKIIKIFGPFLPFESTDPSFCYPAIVVQDATACCASGIEFLLYGVPRCSMSGGNGYPLYNEDATIVGKYDTYLEGTSLYGHLVDAIWLKNA